MRSVKKQWNAPQRTEEQDIAEAIAKSLAEVDVADGSVEENERKRGVAHANDEAMTKMRRTS